jgi:hypothetical protein
MFENAAICGHRQSMWPKRPLGDSMSATILGGDRAFVAQLFVMEFRFLPTSIGTPRVAKRHQRTLGT